ncbi:MAG: electron transfer flavoprotein subunit alpha/FixB family protein [Thermodesulfobacteriota bacterium]|jgi:electron transfer flavoprotein alpha subunit
MAGIWIFVEQRDGVIRKVSMELLSGGRGLASTLGEEVAAVLFGDGVGFLAEELSKYTDTVYVIDDPLYHHYSADSYGESLAKMVRECNPSILLGGSTFMGRDLFPWLACRLATGYAADCIDLTIGDDKGIIAKRPMYGGKVLADVTFSHVRPQMATVRPNVFTLKSPDGEKNGEIIRIEPKINPTAIRTRVERVEKTSTDRVDLTEADIVVAAGRGIKGPENFHIIEELAEVINATVGTTRAVVDNQWRDHDDQIGKSGKVISPKLYMAFGISGAIHHTMGIDTSNVIVAVDKNPNSLIFTYADYGIVGDLFQIVPALTAEFKKALSE